MKIIALSALMTTSIVGWLAYSGVGIEAKPAKTEKTSEKVRKEGANGRSEVSGEAVLEQDRI